MIVIFILTFFNLALLISLTRRINCLNKTAKALNTHNLAIMGSEQAILWKVRQDIYAWQCNLIAKEQYEAAQQTKKVITNIETLIEKYNQFLNTNYETNRKTNKRQA